MTLIPTLTFVSGYPTTPWSSGRIVPWPVRAVARDGAHVAMVEKTGRYHSLETLPRGPRPSDFPRSGGRAPDRSTT
jgi:hypothetical protein